MYLDVKGTEKEDPENVPFYEQLPIRQVQFVCNIH